MTAIPHSHPAAPAAVLSHTVVTANGVAPADHGAAASLPDAGAVAHRAVDAVLTAVERAGTADRHAVNLQFSFGGTDLSVRVELKADQVHATFHTDSADLRSALAHEWQAARAGGEADGQTFRLAPPVFGPAETTASGQSAFTPDTASHDRHSDSRRPGAEQPFTTISSNRGGNAEVTAGASGAVGAISRRDTALHLHTLA